ncbi:hypothetical protein [Bacteroides neonati]|uniref:hypothetical protein n=1 Tax=Bacteroides neonati TaxID=1347393 RepID=UPI0004B857F2|nr:hypothetical protein [Bacteroides neonati]
MNWETKRNLYMNIHHIIEQSISGLKSKQEPDYIAALVTHLPVPLSSVLNKALPNLKFKVGGCFIHQKPLTTFCDPKLSTKSPEIGDLLIIYKEIRSSGDVYNALLLQAKKATNIYKAVVSKTDYHQLLLYTKWPKFEYARAGALNGRIRSIQPKSITPGAQYLLIDDSGRSFPSPCGITTFWCAMPDNILVANNSLALQIIKLLEFQTGRPFDKKNNSRYLDHWSKMIWDLLNLSSVSCFNRRKAGYNNVSRQAGDAISLIINRNNDKCTEYQLPDEGGISIICIEGVVNERVDELNEIE